jgi:heme A synthase
MPWHLIFLVAALVFFILAAFNTPSSRVNLTAAGLACLTIAQFFMGGAGLR